MNIIDIFKTAGVNLWRNKGRTFLTAIAIFIGAFTIAMTTAVNSGVNNYISKQLGFFGGSRMVTIQKKQDMANFAASASVAEYQDSSTTSSQK